METKTYLSQIERLDRMIQNKLTDIYQLQHMATSISAPQKEVNVKSSGSFDKMGDTVSKLVDLQEETNKLIDTFVDKRQLIISQIDGLEDTDMYHILTEHYVNQKDWNKIAVETGYSFRNIMIIHKKALKEFEKKYGDTYLG